MKRKIINFLIYLLRKLDRDVVIWRFDLMKDVFNNIAKDFSKTTNKMK